MANLIVIVVLLVIVGISVSYIIKEKKRGAVCIGCPHAGECTNKRQGGCTGHAETKNLTR